MNHKHSSIVLIAILALLTCSVLASAQTANATPGSKSNNATQDTPQSTNRTNANENFDLNIAERRINESDYAASTSVEAGEETQRGLMLRVGVGLSAGELDVLLRNVRGHVRFHASLDRVIDRLNTRRASETVP